MRNRNRSTPAGQHRPVMLREVMDALTPHPGETVVDCTVGWGGHAVELLKAVGSGGRLIGLDLDATNLPEAEKRLSLVGHPFILKQANFAGLPALLSGEGIDAVDALVADLGMSSMQVDDAARGFSYRRDGPLDMRMDSCRGLTAAEVLETIPEARLAKALKDLGDEPEAELIAEAIVTQRKLKPVETTNELVQLILAATQTTRKQEWRLHPTRKVWNIHPAARTFQALRILVNRELANLLELMRVLRGCLRPGGRAAIITFHSGEDRIVKAGFRTGLLAGGYSAIADIPIRATFEERQSNPRSRSAKLRWAKKSR